MSRRSTKSAIAIVALLLATATSPVATAQTPPPRGFSLPPGASDISATATGRRLASEASARYTARGVRTAPLRVIEDGGGMLVAPADTRFATYEVTLRNGGKATALAPLTPAAPAGSSRQLEPATATAAVAPSWTFIGNDCFTRISDTWSWMDHCYDVYRLSNDGNSSFDWFALAHHASMGPNFPWAVTAARIQATRYQSSPQTWADWSPKADWSGGSCGTISVGVALPIGGIGITAERCPQVWDFWKSANGTQPDYKLTWLGPGTREDRELAFEISVRVAQGGWAQWYLPAIVHGGPL